MLPGMALRHSRTKLRKTTRRRFIALLLVATPAVLVADAFLIEPRWLKPRVIRLCTGKPTLRVAHFTDLHYKGDKKFALRLVARINRLEPHLVCFTGDLFDEPEHLPEALERLRQIKAPLYGVPGNHDFWGRANFALIRDAFASTGGRWLMDESVQTADGKTTIHGAAARPPTFEPNPETKNVLLMHYPDWVEQVSTRRFDLILAGHSHGGQVRLPFFGPVIETVNAAKYSLGLYRTQAGPLYVGSGVGWFYTRARFNCRPELALLEL